MLYAKVRISVAKKIELALPVFKAECVNILRGPLRLLQFMLGIHTLHLLQIIFKCGKFKNGAVL